ncbi:MAG: purine/pyrimidine permease [Candidatus Delongbacteria bacterium]|nr:purine/pyrimidine permease [Candidatus Delongbacteria bacterium]
MAKSTKHYEYTVNEVPPVGHLIVLSIQHVFLMVMSLGLPILFANQISGSVEFAATLIAFSMLAAGIGSIIQSVGLPFIGSGYLCPNLCGPSYFSLSLSAAWVGGMPLMRGMIIIAGFVEMALSPIIEKLKKVFPTYVVGLVVAMVGVSVIKSSVTSFFGLAYHGDGIRNLDIAIGIFSLMVMVISNLWGKGFFKMYCLLIGMLSGWILAFILVPEYWDSLSVVKNSPLFALPHIGPEFKGISFDLKMLIPFVVIAISGSLKSFGNLLAAQKISEPDLKEPNFVPIRKGLLADGFSTALAGFLGGIAVDTSSSNIGLAGATKVVSRWISVGAGVLFVLLAFFPKMITFLSMMPKPVLGASIIFAGCFMISTGLKEVFSEGWDGRKNFVVGISLFFGLSTAFLPGLYARAPQFIQTFFTDPLPTTTILAVMLNQILNLDLLFKKLRSKK